MNSLFVPSKTANGTSGIQRLEIVRMFIRLIAMLLWSIVMLDAHAAKNIPPTVTMTATLTVANAPGAVALTATASDSDGSIVNVQFFNGTTLLATVTQAPYAYTWSNVPAGTYSLTARATDNRGTATTTPASVLTVLPGVPQVHYVYADQINSPREITNESGNLMWRADALEPFGANVPNENPAGFGTFTYNVRFPGQYFDKETGMHHNYFRDYDPQLGRYIQSDPIGLRGGINTYGYVGGNPVSRVDPTGEFFFVPVIYYGGSALIAGGVAYYGVKAMSRPSGMSRLEERHFDRHCNNTDDPCRNLKAAVATAISEARVKMDAMRNDKVLYEHAYSTPNPSVTNTATTWVGHARDLDGRINNIWAMISLGRNMGCDMSSETTAAMTLLTPGAPNP